MVLLDLVPTIVSGVHWRSWDRAPRREKKRRRRLDAGLQLPRGAGDSARDAARRRAALMPRIARASIDQVQAAADMVELVGQYTELRKAGANYSGRCPFHEERTPSFSVNPAEKLYYCFGCGAGGNLFGFVQAEGEPRLRRAPSSTWPTLRHRARVRGVERSRRRGASPPRAPARPARTGDGLLRARAARGAGGGAGPRVPRAARPRRRRLPPVPPGLQPRRAGTSCATPPAPRSSATRSCSTPAWSCRASAASPTTAFAAASCSRWPTTAGARWASAPAPWATRSPSTSTRRRRRCTTRARRSSGSTRRQGGGRQGRPRLRRRGLHRRAGARPGRRPERRGQHGHRAHGAAAPPSCARDAATSTCASTRTPPVSAR